MRLSIVIPAYNEEEAIAGTIERCLSSRRRLLRESCVDSVEVIVVSDGSTDATASIARGYREIHLIEFERNRGYGAAIQRGFEESSGELVGFLDADGTCDPEFFAELCAALQERGAAVAIGSRIHSGSKMPRLRRWGNRFYALMLSALSKRVVTDTASGMRVIRREALQQLYPLPEGLHFTPAMSARVLMDDALTIVEIPMPYEERIGESKLCVVRDGVRFLRTILEMTLMWKPARLFTLGAAACLAITALLSMHPLESWLREGGIAEDQIYRLLFCSFLGTLGSTLLSAGVLAESIRRLAEPKSGPSSFAMDLAGRIHGWKGWVATATLGAAGALWLTGGGWWTRLTLGRVQQHWSRAVLAGLVLLVVVQMGVTVMLRHLMNFHMRRATVSKTRSMQTRFVAAAAPIDSELLDPAAEVPHAIDTVAL